MIGVFDSGVGGLSVLSELERELPSADFVYFGDTKNLPYGTKSAEEIISFTKEIIKFFISKGAKDVVMACNTSSALAYDTLKKEFEGAALTIHPLIQTVAKEIAKSDKIGVMATEGTVKSRKYTAEIQKNNPNAKVWEVSCSGLVEIVEGGLLEDEKSIELIKSKLLPLLDNGVSKVVLGCTHYPFLLPVLEKFAPKEMFINPAKALSRCVGQTVSDKGGCGKREFYTSSDPKGFLQSAQMFYEVEHAKLADLGAKNV